MDNSEYRLCPFCSEEIKLKAVKCKYCHSLLDEQRVAEIGRIRSALFSDPTELEREARNNSEFLNENQIEETTKIVDLHLDWLTGSYSGAVVNGQFHGQGIMILPGGQRYEGDWFEGKKHGEGILTDSAGTKIIGRWIEDEYDVPPVNAASETSPPFVYSPEPEEERIYPEEERIYAEEDRIYPEEERANPPLENQVPPLIINSKVATSAAREDDLVECPHCSAKIFAYALKCKHCHNLVNHF